MGLAAILATAERVETEEMEAMLEILKMEEITNLELEIIGQLIQKH